MQVVPTVGLIIAFYEFVQIKEAKILAGDGRAHFKVVFRMIVFQPFIGEILQGTVSGSDSVGLTGERVFFLKWIFYFLILLSLLSFSFSGVFP